MSIFSSIGHVVSDVVGWIKGGGIKKVVKDVFSNKNKDFLKEVCTKAVVLVAGLRETLANPTVDDITKAIPGDWDDKTVAKVRLIIPEVLEDLKSGEECGQLPTIEEQGICIFAKIRAQSEIDRANSWTNVASKIAYALSDGKLEIPEILMMIPAVWTAIFKPRP